MGSSSYIVLLGTAVQFRLKGQGIPLFELLREYKYTGNSIEQDEVYRLAEYTYTDKKTGEKHILYYKRKEGSKIPRAIYERLQSRKRIRYYVGHYDPVKFKEQMQRYRDGRIRSRPNGRRWCLINEKLEILSPGYDWMTIEEYYEATSL